MKLKNKMLFLIGIPIFLVIIILTAVSYTYSRSLLISESRETMLAYTQKYASDIETIILSKKTYVDVSAANVSKRQERGALLLDNITDMAKQITGIADFYVAFDDKTYLSGLGLVPDASFDPTSRAWYKAVMGTDKTYVSDPYVAFTGKLVMAISHGVSYNGKAVGVLGADIAMDEFQDLIKSIKYGEYGKAFLVNKSGKYIIDDKYTLDDNVSKVENGQLAELANKISSGQLDFLSAKVEGVSRFYAVCPIKDSDWVVVLEAPESEVISASTDLAFFMLIIGIVSILLLLVIIYLIANSVSKPIIRLSECIQGMVEYDFTLSDTSPSVIYSKNKDEIGIISRALITVKQTIQGIMTQITDIANQVSASSEELTASSEHSADISKTLTNTVEEISKGVVMQAEDMQKGAEAMQVMDNALTSNESIIKSLNSTIEEVSSAKEQGLTTILKLINATKELGTSSQNVHDVILDTNERALQISTASNMIKSISDQTNLLALNAAIEAARAGEAGKGFAVVAEEIRKLAEQSNQFTEEIQEIVQGLTAKVSETVDIMEVVGNTVAEQNNKVNETQEIFNLISSELDKNMSEMNNLNSSVKKLEVTKESLVGIIENLSALSEENAAAAQESSEALNSQLYSSQEVASASASLSELAQNMIEMINKFKI